MSDIHLFRIEQHLKSEFSELISLSDIKHLNKTEQNTCFLSRSQAALAVKYLTNSTNENAANSVCDGFGDNGIDAIYIDNDNKTLYLVQSKWISKGNTSPKKKEIQSFLIGVDDLIKLRFDKFNDKIKERKTDLINCFKDISFKIRIVLTYTSNQPVSNEAKKEIDEKVNLYNDSTDLFSHIIVNQKELYKGLLSGIDPSPINLNEITIYNWGKHTEPYEGLYGEVEAEQIAKLWKEYGQSLMVKNLRQFKDVSQVNDLIKFTISNQPQNFWYFNNGITALCKGIGKSAIHGNDRTAGVFSFKDVSIVNGAQTFGSIGDAYKYYPDQIKNAKVQIRFINLANAPEGFEKEITRYTNTQNRIENKDFASLDPEQERLKHELLLDKKEYVYKTGEKIMKKDVSCDIEEATYALACAHEDISLSVIAHRNIGTIWLDIERPPYKSIFNSLTTGQKLWRAVTISRIVKDCLSNINNLYSENMRSMTAIHGDGLILYKVFQIFGRENLDNEDPKLSIDKKQINDLVDNILVTLCEGIDQLYPGIYINSLFKNTEKITRLSKYIDVKLNLEKNLFTDI